MTQQPAATTPTVPAYRSFDVTVAAMTTLSPHFVRITFTGPDLELFGDTCLDQRIKVVLPLLPLAAGDGADGFAHFPRGDDWYGTWRQLPAERQNPFRTYTVRAVRQDRREVDIDFVRHGDAGPASAWAGRAAVGDPCILVGPDRRGDSAMAGVEWRPGAAGEVLLAGDETAVPAVGSILASLPAHVRGQVFVEVPTDDDVLHLEAPAGVDVRWLPRSTAGSPAAEHGTLLVEAVTSDLAVGSREDGTAGLARLEPVEGDGTDDELWEVPEQDPAADAFAWIAGEASAIRALRRFLVAERGWDRRQVAFMGYWRIGRAES